MDDYSIRLQGNEPGESSLILVGVHGDERCGVEAIQRLLPDLVIERGTVCIEYGNPRALEQSKRFTEANLNRMFKPDSQLNSQEKSSYEYQRAQYLKRLMDKAGALLDVHASFTPESRPFLICEPNGFDLAAHLPFNTVVTGFDAVEPGGTDHYMNARGKIGISVECGYLGDPRSVDVATDAIRAFLRARGHLSSGIELPLISQSRIGMYMLYLTKTDAFQLARPFADFETVSPQEVIGIDGETEIRASKESVILFARNQNEAGTEAFLLGEKRTAERR